MIKNKLIKFVFLPLATSATVITPVVSAIACGNNPHKPGQQAITVPPKTSLNLKDVQLSEYDVERKIINTEKNGILPLSRIQQAFEGKDQWSNLHKIESEQASVMFGLVTKNGTTKVDVTSDQFIEHAKIFVDSAITVNGNPQSLSNPLVSFTITKNEIMTKATAYEDVSDKIQNYISAHSSNGEKYSVLTLATKSDSADSNNEYKDGEFKINIYQKPANKSELNRAINILKSSKFGSDVNALKKLGGFTLTPVTATVNAEPNRSIYSNFLQSSDDADNLTDKPELFTGDKLPRVYDESLLKDPTTLASKFTATKSDNGSSNWQFASNHLTNDEMDFLDKNAWQVGDLEVNRKTNSITLELTVITVPDAKKTVWTSSYGTLTPAIENDLIKNYEAGSAETIWIDLPLHTSWLKNDAVVDNSTFRKNLLATISSVDFYKNLLALANDAVTNEPDFWIIQGLLGPNIKGVLVDNITQLQDLDKYLQLFNDDSALSDFITFASQNSAFDKNTLNQVLVDFQVMGGMPSDVSSAIGSINSSTLYTTMAYANIFYTELEKFLLSPEGQKYQNLISSPAPSASAVTTVSP